MSENVKIENKKTGGKDLTAEIKNLVVEFRTDRKSTRLNSSHM